MNPGGDAFAGFQPATDPGKNVDDRCSTAFDSLILLERYMAGDSEAATLLFRLHAARLAGLARSHLSPRLASRIEPDDVVQSAFRSFFLNAREGRYILERSGDLWRLLAAITRHKLARQVRHHLAEKRSVASEIGGEAGLPDIADEPEPDSFEELAEVLRDAMRAMPEFDRRVLELRLLGQTQAQIAEETGRSERTIRRALARITADLKHRVDHDGV